MRTVEVTIYNRFERVYEIAPIFEGDLEIQDNVSIDEATRPILEKWCEDNGSTLGSICWDNGYNCRRDMLYTVVRFKFNKRG